jgi:hypothetical protein
VEWFKVEALSSSPSNAKKKKRFEVAILIADKTECKTKVVARDRGHFIMIKGSGRHNNSEYICA